MSWLLAVQGGILAGSFIYHRWLTDKEPGPKPGEGTLPRTDEGAPVPLIYGRCRVRAPVLAFSGGGNAVPFGDGPGDDPLGFVYSLSMLWVVGIPFYGGATTLAGLYAADFVANITESIPLFGSIVPGRYRFSSSNLFEIYGGPGKGGGVTGSIEFFDGRPDQVISDGVDDLDASRPNGCLTDTQAVLEVHPMNNLKPFSTVLPSLIPSYRNMAICCMFAWQVGESPNITTYGFDIKSVSGGTAADLGQDFGDDADPAAVIYDLLTSPFGKLGLPASKVNRPSFVAASLVLFSELHGYSRAIEAREDAVAIIGDILAQIDGLLYEEPTTGELVLKLVRNDYSLLTIDEVNPDNASPAGSGWYQVQGWSETINQVRLSFTDRIADFSEGSVLGQNAATIAMQGARVRSTDIRFVGCNDRILAKTLASRELAAMSQPSVKATMIVDRTFYDKRPGDVIALTWPDLGIARMPMRIARVDLGQLHDGKITLDMIRDAFDVTLGAF